MEARHIANTGRGPAGTDRRQGRDRAKPFWQFRPFTMGEPVNRIDWRRSARDDHLFVREREMGKPPTPSGCGPISLFLDGIPVPACCRVQARPVRW